MPGAHTPVLLQHVIEGLLPKEGMTILDATLGGSGYSKALCEQIGATGTLIGIDQDAQAVLNAQEQLQHEACTIKVFESNFRDIPEVLAQAGVGHVDGVVFDLGLSSIQLEHSGRGFSFQKDEPLMMTFKERPEESDLTAKYIVNEWSEEALANALFGYGEERAARKIARAIVQARERSRITTTRELADSVAEVLPRRGKLHPATKTFQALRIAVNDEVRALEEALQYALQYVTSGGRIVVVSFHSIEDRIVKRFFKACEAEATGRIITKKPITPTSEERTNNPRSRSAKLRILERI